MRWSPNTTNARAGMTLVELLVVLAILASVAVGVAVSTATAMDRARVETTIRQGEAIVAALEAADGASAVSDMGALFDTDETDETKRAARNLSRLAYLFAPTGLVEVTVEEASGTVARQIEKRIPHYRTLAAAAVPSANPPGCPEPFAEGDLAILTNGCGAVTLGCGWRGPYVRERVDGRDGALRDGFGGVWEFDATPTNCLLVSRGRDRKADGLDTVEWQDEDLLFPVRQQGAVTLAIEAEVPFGEATPTPRYLHVFAFAPAIGFGSAGEYADASIAWSYHAATNATTLAIEGGLTPGLRKFFVFAQAGTELYSAPPAAKVLRHGVNELKVRLDKRR